MFVIDKYAYQSRWKNISSKYKFILYVVCLIISFSGIELLQGLLLLVLIPFTAYIARVSLLRYAKWYMHASIFIGISMLTFVVTFSNHCEELIYFFPIAHGYLGINRTASYQLIEILLRIYSCLASTYFFTLTVPFVQMIKLFRSLKVPSIFLELLVLVYRFIFLVMYEFIIIRDTLDLKFSFYNRKRSYIAWARLANTLLLKLLEDNKAINDVLKLRFDATNHDD